MPETFGSINGQSGLDNGNGFYLGDSEAWSYLDVPTARAGADGTRPLSITAIYPYMAGRDAARSATVWISKANGSGRVTSSAFSLAASGSAFAAGRKNLPGVGYFIRNVGSGQIGQHRIGFDTNGSAYYGRNVQAGNAIRNAAGSILNSDHCLAGDLAYAQVPTAPGTPSVVQVAAGSVKATWSAPSDDGGKAVTGYAVQRRINGGAWTQVQTVSAREATISGLPAGGQIEVRISALNAVSLAAGIGGPYSGTGSALLVAEEGDIDDWEIYGPTFPNVEAFTPSGLRRSVVAIPDENPLALLKENVATSGTASIPSGFLWGARRAISGLEVGKVYRLQARAALTETTALNRYALGVEGVGFSDDVTLGVLEGQDLPPVEFVATATTHTIAVGLAEGGAYSGNLERLAVWGIALSELPSESPYRLASTVKEASLAEHFDTANNSIGGRWWVDAFGITRFSSNLGDSAPVAVFSDVRGPGRLEYVDIETNYDTRNVVNDLTLEQHVAVDDPENPGEYITDDTRINVKDLTSIATWGIRRDSMEVTLYDDDAYAGSLQARAGDVLAEHSDAELKISRIRWNAQEDPYLAAQLEIYAPIVIEFRGITQISRILSIRHQVTPKRWMITLDVIRKEG